MRHSRHLAERFIDVEDMKDRFANNPKRDILYTIFADGEDWDTYSDLDDAKEVADDIYSNFGKSVKVCDGNGKVVYRPRYNVESRRPRGRMLREARKAKPKYFQGHHVMHANLGEASGELGDKIKEIVDKGILNKLDELFEDNFGRKMDISYDERSHSYNVGENVSVEKWFAKWNDIFADKIFDEMDDAEILVPNKRVKSAEFNKIERRVKDRYSSMSDAKVWWGAIEAAKRIVSEFDWDKDDDLYDAEEELLAIEGLEGKSDEDMDESLNRHGRMLREGENKSEEFMKELVAIVEEESPFMGDNFIDVETDYNGGESWSGFINFTDGTIDRRAYWMPGTYSNLRLKGVDAVSSKNATKVQKLVDSLESEDDKIVSFFEDNLDKVNDMLPETAKPFKTAEDAFKWYMNFDPNEESDQYDIFGGTSHSGERKNLEVFYEELNDDINEYIQEFYSESPAFVGILVILDDDKEEGKVCRVQSYVNDDLGYGREAVGAWAGKNVIGEGIGNHYIYDQSFTWKNLSDLKRNLAKHVALAAETIGAN